jgi:hypothetical protein
MSLGLVATGKRSIKSGSEYAKYFTTDVEGKEVVLLQDGDVHDTLSQMKSIVNKTLKQTKGISTKLKGDTREATARNVWNFLYTHVQYKKDHPLREQLRTPARTWKDRRAGVDCDCYSIFISSVLTNLGIPHSFRMAGYDGDFQHVYVVVPKTSRLSDRASYYAIDPVVNRFDYEPPFTKKHDQMARVTMLNGLGECNPTPEILRWRQFMPTQQIIQKGGVPTRDFLEGSGIPFAPAYDDKNENAVYVISTKNGLLSLPTVISPQQSKEVIATVGECIPGSAPGTDEKPSGEMGDDLIKSVKKFPWVWIAVGAGVLILLTGGDQKEVKSGLNGPPSKRKKAYKAINI